MAAGATVAAAGGAGVVVCFSHGNGAEEFSADGGVVVVGAGTGMSVYVAIVWGSDSN